MELTIRKWTFIENNMICVERALEYTTLEQEGQDGSEVEKWPADGAFTFEKVCLCYGGCKTAVLKDLSFEVRSRERVGIVGRTGAGKSSIVSVLFRLYPFEGTVKIDGVDSKSLSLKFLRYIFA